MKTKCLKILIVQCLFMMGCLSGEKGEPSSEVLSIGDAAQISLSCVNIEKSLAFYKKLHYSILEVQLDTQIPWAVISDGSQLIMLSQNDFPSPALTFYGKSLPDRIKRLQVSGLDLETITDERGQIKSAILHNPAHIGITLIDFDTRLLLKPVRDPDFSLGNFANIKISVSSLTAALAFWEKAGFNISVKEDVNFPQVFLEQAKLKINLLPQNTIDGPALAYINQNENKLLRSLKNAKIEFRKTQRNQSSWVMFESPDKQLFIIELEGQLPQK